MANPINPNILKLLVGKSPTTISHSPSLPLFHQDLYLQNFISSAFYSLNFHPSQIIIHKSPSQTIARLLLYSNPSITPLFHTPTLFSLSYPSLSLKNYLTISSFSSLFYPLSLNEINYVSFNSFVKTKKNIKLDNIILIQYLDLVENIHTRNKLKKLNKKINKMKNNNKEVQLSDFQSLPYPKKKISYISNLYNNKFYKISNTHINKKSKKISFQIKQYKYA